MKAVDFKYRATFLVPKDANRVLTREGWEFASDQSVPEGALAVLVQGLGLLQRRHEVDAVDFDAPALKVTVFRRTDGTIESIYCREYGVDPGHRVIEELLGAWRDSVDVFVPSKSDATPCEDDEGHSSNSP